MLVKEYRIPFPTSLEEYRIGMLYMVARATDEENRRVIKETKDKFITVVRRERYYDHERHVHGIYTEKVCNVRNLLPSFIKVFVPASKSILIEKAWNAFPEHCMTTYECPFLGDSFHLSIQSRYIESDYGNHKNALRLNEQELQERHVVNLNIASEEHIKMTPETNVQQFQSKKTGRPALDADGIWIRETTPVMCCYKVCKLGVSTKGLPGSRIEKWGHRHGLITAFMTYHRQQLCWIDSWFGLNVSEVDGLNDGFEERMKTDKAFKKGLRPKLAATATAIATEISAESSAGLVFAFSDNTNPFIT